MTQRAANRGNRDLCDDSRRATSRNPRLFAIRKTSRVLLATICYCLAMPLSRGAHVDRMLRPVHRWIWSDVDRRVRKLLRLRGSRGRWRTRHPARRGGHAGSALAPAVSGSCDRRTPPRRSVPPAWRRPASSAVASVRHALSAANWLPPAATASTICALKTSPTNRCSRSCMWRKRPRPAASRSIGTSSQDDPPTRADVRRDPARRSVSHELHLHAACPHLATTRTGGGCGGRARAACGTDICAWRSAIAGLLGTLILTMQYFVLLPPFAWLAKRAVRRERPGWAADLARAQTSRRPASIEMKILGISAHYHDSAAALVCRWRARLRRPGRAPVAHERMTRPFRSGPSNGASITAGLESGRSRRRGLLRAQHAEVRADPDLRAAGVSPLLEIVSSRDEELARRKGLGARHHLVRISACPEARFCSPTHHQAHAAAAFLTAPTCRAAILTADGVGEWATLTVGHGERRADGATDITLLREIRYPAFARHVVFDVHRLSRLRRERRRIQGHGPGGLRPAHAGRPRAQIDPPHAGRRI